MLSEKSITKKSQILILTKCIIFLIAKRNSGNSKSNRTNTIDSKFNNIFINIYSNHNNNNLCCVEMQNQIWAVVKPLPI